MTDAPAAKARGVRRRNVVAASARSQLLTVLGEFVHPAGEPVWTSALLAALGALGHEEKSARQSLNRTATEGVLDSERHGRRVRWHLTDHGRRLLEEGTGRIYGFQRSEHPWDGRWLVLSAPVPESQRQLRHRLRTRLSWLGMGTPTPGLWISPDVTLADVVRREVDALGLAGLAVAWAGPLAGTGEQGRLLEQAWGLADVAARYEDFLDDFAGRAAADDTGRFVAQVQLIEAWRRFPFLDPDLPAELLPHDWPGHRAASCFHARHAQWAEGAHRAWRTFMEPAPPASSREPAGQ